MTCLRNQVVVGDAAEQIRTMKADSVFPAEQDLGDDTLVRLAVEVGLDEELNSTAANAAPEGLAKRMVTVAWFDGVSSRQYEPVPGAMP